MAKHEMIVVNSTTWTLVSDGVVGKIRIQNWSGTASIVVQATLTTDAPVNLNGSIKLPPNDTIMTNFELKDIFPGLVVTTGYVWVKSLSNANINVSVSHA